jgi:hypothetical protein
VLSPFVAPSLRRFVADPAMSQRRSFLLRIDPAVLEAVQRWADDDLRSLNGQIEFLLRRVLMDSGRGKRNESNGSDPPNGDDLTAPDTQA